MMSLKSLTDKTLLSIKFLKLFYGSQRFEGEISNTQKVQYFCKAIAPSTGINFK